MVCRNDLRHLCSDLPRRMSNVNSQRDILVYFDVKQAAFGGNIAWSE